MNLIPKVWVHTARIYDNNDKFIAEVVTMGNEPAKFDNLLCSTALIYGAAVITSDKPDGGLRVLMNRWGSLDDRAPGMPRPRKPENKPGRPKAEITLDPIVFNDIREATGFVVEDCEGDRWRYSKQDEHFEFACADENFVEWSVSLAPAQSINRALSPFTVVEVAE